MKVTEVRLHLNAVCIVSPHCAELTNIFEIVYVSGYVNLFKIEIS